LVINFKEDAVKTLKAFLFLVSAFLISGLILGCGKGPSPLLRVGQAPIFDFPLYVSSGDGTGTIWKFAQDGTKTVFVTGLNDPKGVATDKFNNLWVVEAGASRLLKISLAVPTKQTVVRSGLDVASVVAVDSFGEAYVTQEGQNNIIRASDGKVVASYASRATAVAFGVNDLMLVGLYDDSRVFWGSSATSPNTTVSEPVMITTDATGRVYVAEGSASNAKVYRYHQKSPDGLKVVADGLNGATGIAVDAVGNIYIAEPGASRIVLVTYTQELYLWSSIVAPQYMTFTQY
jgi:sugar lactone lactonase YvrE